MTALLQSLMVCHVAIAPSTPLLEVACAIMSSFQVEALAVGWGGVDSFCLSDFESLQ